MSFNKAERAFYEDHLKWLGLENSFLRKAEGKGFDKGIEQGREEEKKQIAINLLEHNFTIATIALVTGLSIATIEELTQK